MNEVLLTYPVALTPITPIHVGNGEEILPYEYVIHKGFLYKFNPLKIYEKLPAAEQKIFTECAENSMIALRQFISKIYKEDLGYEEKIQISSNFIENYTKKLGGAKDANEENAFIIKDFVNSFGKAYIPGSSLKGAIRSAYLYDLGKQKKIFDYQIVKDRKGRIKYKDSEFRKAKEYENKLLKMYGPKDDPFKIVKITDSQPIENALKVYDIYVYTYKKTKDQFVKGVPYYSLCTKSILSTKDEIEYPMQLSILSECFSVGGVKIKMTIEDILQSLNKKAEDLIYNEINFYKNTAKYEETKRIYEEIQKIHFGLDKQNAALIRFGRGAGFDTTTFNIANKRRNKGTDPNSRSLAEKVYPLGWAVIKFAQ